MHWCMDGEAMSEITAIAEARSGAVLRLRLSGAGELQVAEVPGSRNCWGGAATSMQELPASRAGQGEDLLASREFDGLLRRFLRRRVRSRDDADDLAQEVYLRIVRHPDTGRIRCLRAFAFQTALNLVRDRSRRSYTRSQSRSVPVESVQLQAAENPAESVMFGEELERVMDSVRAMPRSRRLALLLHRVDGCSYASIATRMGVSVSMVEKYISAALLELRGEPGAA